MQTSLIHQKKARAYVRVSTLKDSQKDSPEHQEGLIRETAAQEDIQIEHVYIDRGTATSIVGREDVQNLISDAKKGEFDTIYFASLSRFSRDTLDAISLKRMLVNALKIRLVSIEDFYDSSKEDNEMIFSIVSSVNQKQSENTSAASKRGKRQSALKGNFTGSIAPYGYKKEFIDGKRTLTIIPEHAEVVKLIYRLYVEEGLGEKAIVNYLNNEEKLLAPKGNLWGLSTIQRILRNENYTGYLVSGKHEKQQYYEDVDDLQNRRRKQINKSEDKWDRTDFQTHEAIISKDLFNKTKQIRLINGGGKRGGRRVFVNVFAKLIFCKECGSAMVTMNSGSRNKKYRYLMCSKRRRQGENACKNKTWIPYYEFRDVIIAESLSRINRIVKLDSETTDEIVKNSEFKMKDYNKELKQLDKKINDYRKLLFEIRKQNMLNEIENDQYNFEKEQYEKEIHELSVRMDVLQQKANKHQDYEKLRKEIQTSVRYLKNPRNLDNVEQTRMNLIKLIDRIEVNSEGEADIYTVLAN